jgi:hypothetical protein
MVTRFTRSPRLALCRVDLSLSPARFRQRPNWFASARGNVANLSFAAELKVARIEFGKPLESLPVMDGEVV